MPDSGASNAMNSATSTPPKMPVNGASVVLLETTRIVRHHQHRDAELGRQRQPRISPGQRRRVHHTAAA
jgi:hypothetical protein